MTEVPPKKPVFLLSSAMASRSTSERGAVGGDGHLSGTRFREPGLHELLCEVVGIEDIAVYRNFKAFTHLAGEVSYCSAVYDAAINGGETHRHKRFTPTHLYLCLIDNRQRPKALNQ